MEYLWHNWPRKCSVCPNHNRSFPHSWLITGFITIVTRRVLHVEQELLTLPEHLSSPSVSSFVRVARSLVFCVMFCGSLFCPFVSFPLVIVLYVLFHWWLLITTLVSSSNSSFLFVPVLLGNCIVGPSSIYALWLPLLVCSNICLQLYQNLPLKNQGYIY